MGIGYQSKQSLITVGSGGIFGQGLGSSKQKFGFLPESMSDSIFAILSEELGFIGSLTIIFLLLLFSIKSFLIYLHLSDDFCKLMVGGLSTWIVLQSIFNIGGIIGLLPLVGIPLPFISYGGSHMLSELIGLGLLLNISQYTAE